MNRWQKVALFNLLTTVIALIACLILSVGMPIEEVITPPSPLYFVIVPALVLLAISENVIFRKTAKQVDYDERDKQIHRKALISGGISFIISIVIMVMAVFYIKLLRHDFSPFILPIILLAGVAVYVITISTVTLLRYR